MVAEKKDEQVVKKDENAVEFMPLGCSDKIRLNATMVRQFIAVPTKSGALPSERDCIRFIMLCRGKRANPFEGDCFLIGYDSQNGPSFSLVCGLELFQKRAAAEESYDGAESGVIVLGPEDCLIERPGTVVMDGEKLIGGWAKVHRKDRKLSEYKSVKFLTYDTGRSRWVKDPGGMIAKVAISQAYRAAFPLALGGLYTQEEMQKVTETGEGLVSARAPVEMPKEITAGPADKPAKKKEAKKKEAKKPSATKPDTEPPADAPEDATAPTTIEQISIFWQEQELSEGKLVDLLRKDKLLGKFDGLDQLAENKAAEVLEKIGVYASRVSK